MVTANENEPDEYGCRDDDLAGFQREKFLAELQQKRLRATDCSVPECLTGRCELINDRIELCQACAESEANHYACANRRI